jgi:tetratricopeptide (TPR) repeat protein
MLSAFTPEPIHELRPKDKSKIESLLAYGDRLLVGLNTGSLRVYRVNDPRTTPSERDEGDSSQSAENGDSAAPPAKVKAVEALRDVEKFSRKPVQQLAIVKEANLIVSLSDGYVSLHDLQTYQLVERLEQTRGATCFAVTSNVVKDPETNIPSLVSRLVVGVKRRLLYWTWQDMELSADIGEIAMEAVVKSLTWATATKIVVGMDAGYSFVDVESKEIVPVFKPASKNSSKEDVSGELAGVRFAAVSSSGMGYMGMGSWVPKPMASKIGDSEVLLAKDVNTLFADMDGKALERRQVPWSFAPEAVGYSYPYLLALQSPDKGSLQVRNPDTLSLLQTISLPQATVLHVPQPNIALAHAGKGFLVASERIIWRMNALSYPQQLQELVEKYRFDEAISLLELLEDTLISDKAGRIREIKILKATSLFEQQKYQQAIELFIGAYAPPDRVIGLYPRTIAGDHTSIPDNDQSETENALDEAESEPKNPPVTPSKSVFDRLKGSHSRADSDTASVKPLARVDTDNMSIRGGRGAPSDSHNTPDKRLEGDDLKQATRALRSFLAQARVQIQPYLNSDGTMKEHPPALDPETGKPVFAHLLPQAVVEKDNDEIDWQHELFKAAQLIDTTLFRAYMFASPTLAGSLFRLDNFCEPDVVQAALYESERYGDLIDFLHGKRLHRQALELLAKFGNGDAEGEIPEGMQGPERTVGYLKQLQPELIDLILEFVRWPLEQDPDVGMDVFLADSSNAENLDREKVRSYLADIDTGLEITYLEHLVNELDDKTPAFHQQLVELYVERVQSSLLPAEEKAKVKAKLEAFLGASRTYSQSKTFRLLPSDEPLLYESRALVLSAMGNHKQALAIYVFQLADYAKAEEYCNRIYITEQACLIDATKLHSKPQHDTSTPNIFAILLGLYLSPPPNETKRWPQALDLLGKHGARLPASSTLSLMPDDLAVAELDDYFRGRIRHATSVLRQEKIMRSLEEVRRMRTERVLRLGADDIVDKGGLGGRSKRVVIGEEDHCRVCHKRFGASAVRVHPDGEVVHYGCVGGRGSMGRKALGAEPARRGWG